MTPSVPSPANLLPPVSRQVAALLLFAALAAMLVIHLLAIGGDFLSDDFVHAGWIADAQRAGELPGWVLERFYRPIASGNYAYRPVVFASYALDWVIYGNRAGGWHVTNLLIHVLNGALMLVLAWRLAARCGLPDARFTAVAAAALFLAIPFAGESTFWPVGRFDLLAVTFSLAFLILLIGRGRTWAMLACLLLALLSKESAMPMLVVGGALLFALALAEAAGPSPRARVLAAARTTLARFWPVIVLALAYFAWRYALFGSPWKVYPDSRFPASIGEAWARVSVLKHVFNHPYGDHAAAWLGLLAVASLAWLAGSRAALRRTTAAALLVAVTLAGCFMMYLLAPATSFAVAVANGEGIRNLYFPWAMFSLLVAFVIGQHRLRVGFLCLGLVIALWGQQRLVSLWQGTAAHMQHLTNAAPALAATLDDSQYALLLLPDHIGAVPFVRNAQGGVVMPPRQAVSYLPKMAAMTPLQFAEWEGHLADNTIGKLKGPQVVFAREAFAGVYCWVPLRGRFERLAAMPRAGQAKAWESATMDEARRAGCLL